MGIAPYFISPKSVDSNDEFDVMPKEVAQDVEAKLNQRTRDKRGIAVVLRTAIDMKRVAFSPQELDSPGTRQTAATRICAGLTMDPMMVGLPSDSKTFNNFGEARRAYTEDNIMPTGQAFLDLLNDLFHRENLLKQDEWFAFNFDNVPAYQEGRAARNKEANEGWTSGRLRLNESRSIVGDPPVESEIGDMFIWQAIPGVPIPGAKVPKQANQSDTDSTQSQQPSQSPSNDSDANKAWRRWIEARKSA